MTAGLLLVACFGLPCLAALASALTGGDQRFERIVSTAAGVVTLSLAVCVVVVLTSSDARTLQTHITASGWTLSPDEPAPTVTFYLERSWAFLPLLASACALYLALNSRPRRSWGVHLQHAAVQGSLFAATPEFGLAMVSLSTIVAAMSLSSVDDSIGRRGLATALRWAFADLVLWFWTAGFFGVGTTAKQVAVVALALRSSVFPFQGALARTTRDHRDVGLLFAQLPAVVWAFRWLDPTIVSNTPTWQLLTATAIVVPALMAMGSRDRVAVAAYQLSSLMLWPIALPMPTSSAIGLVGIGFAAAVCRASSACGVIARTATVVVPTFVFLSNANRQAVTSSALMGWIAVSLAAILMQAGSPGLSSGEQTNDGGEWSEAILVTVAASAMIWSMTASDVATAIP